MRSSTRRLLLSALGLSAVVGIAGRIAFVRAVEVPAPPVTASAFGPPAIEGETARVGGSVLERRPGHWLMTHRGTPEEIGAAHALLGDWLNQLAEEDMFASLYQHVPAAFRPVLFGVIKWQYRHMHTTIPERFKKELYAFSMEYRDRYAGFLPIYQRAVYYHTLHDITQELVGSPLVVACSSFAASGPATVDGHLLIGRNFDFEVFPRFDQEKVVHVFAPEGRIPFVSVSWTGLAGVVTGMNAEGVYISVNAAWSEGRNRVGPPVSILARRVLEEAGSLEEAIGLLEAHRTMVSDIYLVGDGETGRAAVVERGVEKFGVRPMEADGVVTAANHLLSEPFRGDARDAALKAVSTTEARHARLDELVARARGRLDPAGVLEILRDKKAVGDRDLAPGHRDALDALIATHSVVVDATDRVLWVSQAPHLLGPFRRVDLLAELERMGIDTAGWRRQGAGGQGGAGRSDPPSEGDPTAAPATPAPKDGVPAWLALGPGDLPADPFYLSGGWDRYSRMRELLGEARAYVEHDQPEAALDVIARAEALSPLDPDVIRARAEAYAASGDAARAAAEYRRFLASSPAKAPNLGEVEAWLREHAGG